MPATDLVPLLTVIFGAGGVASTTIGWLLGRHRRRIDLAKLATDIAAELLEEMRTEIDRLTEQLARARDEADQLRAELAATRAELLVLRLRQKSEGAS